jgi:hypothetical protein
MNKRNVERVVFVAVAILTVGVLIASINFERRMSNQKLLFYQLQAIRTSINLYKAIEKSNPSSLIELNRAEYEFPDESIKRRFLEVPCDSLQGGCNDPFGNPYFYDNKTGWVRSSTSGYALW